MTDLATFHHALRASPADYLTWLALADWLEETGPDGRAELVRLWCRLRGGDGDDRAARERRVRELVMAGHTVPLPEVTNGVGMRLVLVPQGAFVMGSPPFEANRYADEELHRVTLTRAFWVGVYPVTQAQNQAVMGHNPSGSSHAPDHPVERVGWAEMNEFCAALSESRDEIRAGRAYRLPTDSEWEYACRGAGAHTTPFHFGAKLSSEVANFNGSKPYGGARRGPNRGRTTPVGRFPPNVLGLRDLHGNVWEMCSDYYAEDAGGEPRTDPTGPPSGTHRVLRGGAFDSGSVGCRCAHRGMGAEQSADPDTGFRAVLEWRA
ncbi:MAG: SUMF1/EgtB/PvdO family nonheme iron enzyme [Gemmataceae bacterium]